MLLDYVKLELESKVGLSGAALPCGSWVTPCLQERTVVENEEFVALVPWWALWPYEVMVLPRRRHILRSWSLQLCVPSALSHWLV